MDNEEPKIIRDVAPAEPIEPAEPPTRPVEPVEIEPTEPTTLLDEDSGGSLFGIWNEQRRLQEEEEKMAAELAETKRKAKELQKNLRVHRYGETTETVKKEAQKHLEQIKKLFNRSKNWVVNHRRLSAAIPVLLIVFIGATSVITRKSDPTDTLGDSTTKSIIIEDEFPREKPAFSLLFPAGKNLNDYDVVRFSPEGTDVSYTYLDKHNGEGQLFKVTQQEVPSNFNLENTANNFEATNTIEVDDTTVYYGYSAGDGIQSVIFIKDNKLVSIRSPQKFADDVWSAYVSSLK